MFKILAILPENGFFAGDLPPVFCHICGDYNYTKFPEMFNENITFLIKKINHRFRRLLQISADFFRQKKAENVKKTTKNDKKSAFLPQIIHFPSCPAIAPPSICLP